MSLLALFPVLRWGRRAREQSGLHCIAVRLLLSICLSTALLVALKVLGVDQQSGSCHLR